VLRLAGAGLGSRGSGRLVLRAFLRNTLVASLKALDPARGVDELLLAGEERVALAADLETQIGARRSGAEGLPARADHDNFLISGMDALLHASTPPGRGATAGDALPHAAHRVQELLVALGLLHPFNQQLHRLDRPQGVQDLAENPGT